MRRWIVAALLVAGVAEVAPAQAFSAFKGRFGGAEATCPQVDVTVCGRTYTLPEQVEDGEEAGPGAAAGAVGLARNDGTWKASVADVTSTYESSASYSCEGGQWVPTDDTPDQVCKLHVKVGVRWGERLDVAWDLGAGSASIRSSSILEGSSGTFQARVPRLDPATVCADGGGVDVSLLKKRVWSKNFGSNKDSTMAHRSLVAPSCGNGLQGMVRAWDTVRNSPTKAWDVTGHFTYEVTFE